MRHRATGTCVSRRTGRRQRVTEKVAGQTGRTIAVTSNAPRGRSTCRRLRGWRCDPAAAYRELCGWALARAHACTGDRIALPPYPCDDDFAQTIAEFSADHADHADRHELDFAALRTAESRAESRLNSPSVMNRASCARVPRVC